MFVDFYHGLYIGLIKVGGQWEWLGGVRMTVTNWHQEEPNNAGGYEDCVEYKPQRPNRWNDVECNSKKNYICQIPKQRDFVFSKEYFGR